MFQNWKTVDLLRVVHEDVVFAIHVKDENNVVLTGSESKKPHQGDPGFTGHLFVLQDFAEKCNEALGQDPRALVLDDPVLHFPEAILLFVIQQCDDSTDEIFKVFGLLESNK